MNIDQKYMLRCISLGQNALGSAAPNPMVGAVLVYKNTIVGEGYTSAFGGPHAEVNAIAAVKDKSILEKATLYVTLEPCSHFGKTPPCADLIIKHKIPKVVIGIKDPNPKIAGRGIKRLEAAGCAVKLGILEDACRQHHKRFLTAFEKKRPYIILKWAQTLDGYIAPKAQDREATAQPFWITTTQSRQLVHKWRSEEAAILVGTNTALEDNPRLDCRNWGGENPVRLVLDKQLQIPKASHLLDGSVKTYVFHQEQGAKVASKNVDYVNMEFSKELPLAICGFLHELQLNSLIIEGGAYTLQKFIDFNLWDEARIFTGNSSFVNGVSAPKLAKATEKSKQTILTDTLSIYHND